LAPTILGFSGTSIPFYMKGIDLSRNHAPQRQYIISARGRMDDVYLRSYYVRNRQYQYVQNIDKTPNGADIAFRDVLDTTRALNTAHQQGLLNADQEKWYSTKPDEELYDLKKDPWQLHNIAGEKASGPLLNLFRQKLEQWRNDTDDTAIIPEDQLVKDLQDPDGQTRKTLPPVTEYNPVTGKIYVANRTEGASVGYSLNGKEWELYTGAFSVPKDIKKVFIKAVRYGWTESDIREFSLP
ncbi:TPA: sulfatase family protein, partial [Klebsiella pneumoniae]